jgi:hypothetical protein
VNLRQVGGVETSAEVIEVGFSVAFFAGEFVTVAEATVVVVNPFSTVWIVVGSVPQGARACGVQSRNQAAAAKCVDNIEFGRPEMGPGCECVPNAPGPAGQRTALKR